MKKKLFLGLMVTLVMIGLVACGQDEKKDQKSDRRSSDLVPVKIGMLKLTSSAPLFIALEKGYFEEEGIDAEAEWFEAAQPISVATAGGDVEVGATGITASLYNMVANGEELTIVAEDRKSTRLNSSHVASSYAV